MVEQGLALGRVGATAYCRAGSGPALVLVHGVGLNQGFWAPQIADFAATHEVVAFDTLGHGGSPPPPEPAALGDYARQIRELMDGLGLGRAAIVGHSMGALVALEFALAHPERVAAVIAMNAVYCRSPAQRAAVAARAAALEGANTEGWRQAAIERWFGAPVPAGQMETAVWVGAALAAADPLGYGRAYRLFARADAAHAGRLGALAMPVLFLTGALDPNSAPEMSRRMAAEAANGRAVVLPGARHMMSLTAPATVNQVLRAFLESAAARAPAG